MKFFRVFIVLLIPALVIPGYLYEHGLLGTLVDSPTSNNKTTRSDNLPWKNKNNTPGASDEFGVETKSSDSKGKQQFGIPGVEEDETPYTNRPAKVIEVFDGDTLKVTLLNQNEVEIIRIKGIDCPEVAMDIDKCWSGEDLIDIPCEQQVPLGQRAAAYASARLAGEIVMLESYEGFKEDDYGRTLAYVRTADGDDYGLTMIKKGYCKDYGIRYDHPRDDKYEEYRRAINR